MIILHAGFLESSLALWAEQSALAGTQPSKRSKRSAAAKRAAPPLPYGAMAETLAEAAGSSLGVAAGDLTVADKAVWLPAVEGRPLASSPLIAETPQTAVRPELSPWIVKVFALTPAQAVDLLCQCIGKEVLAPGIVVGSDLSYWASAMKFAGSIVARQSFLPDIETAGGPARAQWKPVYAGADAHRLMRLARLMPHACRALAPKTAEAIPDVPAIEALRNFLAMAVDVIVRSAARADDARAGIPRRPGRKRTREFESLHDQWLYALRAADGAMSGDARELAQFAAQVREWQEPVISQAAVPFRLCFRLEEPPEPDAEHGRRRAKPGGLSVSGNGHPWRVRYLLQATDDPSLIVPATEVWKTRAREAAILKRDGFKPREYLLSALGQAAKISGRVEQSLRTATPEGYDVDGAGAHEFLSQEAGMLEQAGFGVMLPAWWTRKGTKLRLAARAVVSSKFSGGGGLSLDRVVQFNWELALGEERLSVEELEMLARLKSPLVRLRGQWVELNSEEIEAALKFWQKGTASKARVRDLVQMELGAASTAPAGLAFAGVEATGWVGDLLARLQGREPLTELPAPPGFAGQLRPYQLRGYSWLCFLRRWGLGACLADDMGLGKTAETLALIQADWESNGRRPTLVVCPMSVVGNWQKEAERFTPDLPVMVHHGLTRRKGNSFRREAEKHALVLSSYALLPRDLEFLKDVEWSGVILDEAQNIKNAATKQSSAARAMQASYRVALTGTPVENNVGDLWSIMEFLNPGLLGTASEFKRNFFLPIQSGGDSEATERLKRLTGPFVLRRLKTDRTIIADLPDKLEMKVFCTLTKEQASLYAAVVADAGRALEETEGIQRKGVVLATLMKLKQVCNHPAQFLGDNSAIPGRSGKLSRLTEMLEEVLGARDRALVFTQFAEMGAIIQRHLQETFGREVLFLHGAVPKSQRDRMVERFQSGDDGPRVFLLSLKAGGTGLNLTAASHVFHFDRWWNPAVENQATDRAFRIGQRKNVQVHKFICAGTLEEKIDEMIERKLVLAKSIVGTGEGWLTELSTGALKELLALRENAVAE